MTRTLRAFLAVAALTISAAANAGPTLTDLGGNQYLVTFDPLSFEITTDGDVSAIVFEDFYANTSVSCGFEVSGTVQTSLNGGPTANLTGNGCTGIYASLNDVDGNDLLVTIYSSFLGAFGSVSVGDTVSVSSLDYIFTISGLNPAANVGPFSAFLVNNNFQMVSDIVTTTTSAVPEPGTLALLGLSLFGLVAARRRKQ